MQYLKKIQIFIILFFGIIGISQNAFAYEYNLNGSSLSISSISKSKVDIFVSKKIKSSQIAEKYTKALKKVNPNSLKQNKKEIYYYLFYKIQTFDKQTSTPVVNISNTIDNKTDYLSQIKSKTKEYREVNDKYEYIENGSKFALDFEKYYPVDFNNPAEVYISIPTIGNEILYKKSDKYYISKGGFATEKKLNIDDLKSKVKFFGKGDNPVFFDKNENEYQAYLLYKYKYFQVPSDGIYLSQFPSKDANLQNYLLIDKNGTYQLVLEYEKRKLFDSSLLDGIGNKDRFLEYIGGDIYNYKDDDIELYLNYIKNITLSLVSDSQSKDEKISSIYSWITGNIKYDSFSQDYIDGKYSKDYFQDNVDSEVFSGIGAFKNKIAVCDGYAHLFFYMLYFAGIEDTVIETGEANVGNSNWISHAWNKVGNDYYDVTWDLSSKGYPLSFKWYKKTEDDFFKVRRK